ncbi:MAG: gamma-glutamylcyclotransferase [Cyclobacteriaceae bacterium]|nr:gamma-glutamylcyclotransferase [Cyclobacteriaceae bacterium]
MIQKDEFLFVYGWLKKNYRPVVRAKVPPMPLRFLGKGHYPGKLYEIEDYPGIRFLPSSPHRVSGEIYKVDKPLFWKRMDRFELSLPTVQNLAQYNRVRRPVQFRHYTITCWVYEYTGKMLPLKQVHAGVF